MSAVIRNHWVVFQMSPRKFAPAKVCVTSCSRVVHINTERFDSPELALDYARQHGYSGSNVIPIVKEISDLLDHEF